MRVNMISETLATSTAPKELTMESTPQRRLLAHAFCLFFLFPGTAFAEPTIAPKANDLWVMAGDSITAQRLHTNYIEAFYRTRYPNLSLRFRNSGIGGNRTGSVLARFDYDVAAWKPTIADLSRYMPTIPDLSAGQYTVTIDGKPCASLTDNQLAAGWNMGVVFEGALADRSTTIVSLISKLQGKLNNDWRAASKEKNAEKLAAAEKAIYDCEKEVRAACQPAPLHFELRKAN